MAHRSTPHSRTYVRDRPRRSGLWAALLAAVLTLSAAAPAAAAPVSASRGGHNPGTYSNPLEPRIPGDGAVESCADPTVIRGQAPGDTAWYMHCTTDPLNDEDLDASGGLLFHRVPQLRSTDLVHWTYVGDAFPAGSAGLPSWADPGAALWAPEVVWSSTFSQYYLFVVVTDTTDAVSGVAGCHGDNAIGVATGPTPTGPWTFSDAPVVGPRSRGPACGDFLWTFDPEVLGDTVTDRGILYYGSYNGGVFGTPVTLTRSGATAGTTADDRRVTIDNRYEGAEVVQHDGWYYLFGSATNCCNGALTGYSVFVGRSRDPLGPFLDREDQSLLDAQVGGTPFLTMNGNRWVGTGHNTVFQDAAGDWWTVYHAVDQSDPFFETSPGFTKRPALLDAVDWVDGWPTVNSDRGASVLPTAAPAGQAGQRSRHRVRLADVQSPGRTLFEDEFSGLGEGWTWVREAAAEDWSVEDGVLRLPITQRELYQDTNTAAVLLRDAPRDGYVVETRLRVDVPDEDCCFNYAQAGLIVYGDDNNFVKLTNTSIWNTRQTEFAKEVFPVPKGWSRYGNTVVGPPSEDWTWLRIVVEPLRGAARAEAGGDTAAFTAWTSQDGRTWVRGGTWTHTLENARIGLIAMGQQDAASGDFTAEFDHVRVSALRTRRAR